MRVAPDRPDHGENVGIALSQSPVTAATAATVTLYSADGLIAVQEEHDGVIADVPRVVGGVSGDDDLTSLTWLQDNNLLKSVHELPKHEFNDDGASDSTLSNSSASNSSSRKSSNQCINVIPRLSYDPQVHVDSKPPFSFSCLIFMAIEDSDEKALPVKDIYVWILDHFPYYRNAPIGWKNSVRHNLSLNKCFKKVEKLPHLGKGSLWMVEQRFRPCLIQALQKIPHHQYHKFIRNLTVNKKTTADCANYSTCDKADAKLFANNEIETTISQKDLTTETICISENLDDVDAAATAMLVLKHGGYSFDVKAGDVGFVLQNDAASAGGQGLIEITSELPNNCPNDDHNYGYHCSTSVKSNSSYGSNGFANEKETLNSYWSTVREDIEEQRKIVEGADALLNLAGIKTTAPNTRKRVASSVLNNEQQQQRNIKHSCMEQSSLYKPLMVRKDGFSADVNSRKSINLTDISTRSDASNNDENISTDIEPTNVHRIRPRNRATVVKNQTQRKKSDKKRIKI